MGEAEGPGYSFSDEESNRNNTDYFRTNNTLNDLFTTMEINTVNTVSETHNVLVPNGTATRLAGNPKEVPMFAYIVVAIFAVGAILLVFVGVFLMYKSLIASCVTLPKENDHEEIEINNMNDVLPSTSMKRDGETSPMLPRPPTPDIETASINTVINYPNARKTQPIENELESETKSETTTKESERK